MARYELLNPLRSKSEIDSVTRNDADFGTSGQLQSWSASNEDQRSEERAGTASAHRWAQHLAYIALTQPPRVPAAVRAPASASPALGRPLA